MANYIEQSIYGGGYETTTGTPVAPTLGLPQEGLITLGMGDEFETTPKFQGLPYAATNEYTHIGQMPGISGLTHNLSPLWLHRLLASMHGTAGDQTANVFVIGDDPGYDAYPTAGAIYTYGATPSPNYTLSVKHETGASGSVNHVVGGCVCSSLTLTFPAAGGVMKMAYDLVGMSSDDAVASAGTYTLETTGQDAIASDFTYELGVYGTTSVFYPAGDVTITFTPEIEVLKRGENQPYSIIVHKWGGSFSVNRPWDAAGDVDDLYEAYKGGEHFQLKVYNDETPDAVGEYLFDVRGRALTNPTLGGEGIIQESAEFTMCGTTALTPYQIKYFDTAIV
jgi:hypothetical protein